VGGWANGRFGSLRSIAVQLAVLVTMMCLLPLIEGNLAATVATMVVWGVAGFGLTVTQQSRLFSLSPTEAPLLLSLNSSMLYGGTAPGAAISGALVPWVGMANLSWVGAPFGLLALLTLAFDRAPVASGVRQAV
jgi:predicted MFS family arabinose efflux permease